MLLPEKHVTLAESVLGLGAVVLRELKKPRTIDQLHGRLCAIRDTWQLPAYHDIETLLLAVLFLYTVGAVEVLPSGKLRRCA